MSHFLVDWYIDVYLNVYGIDTTYTDIILKFNNILKGILANTTFETLSKTVWTIGFVLMLIYFATDMSEKAAAKQLTFQQSWKSVCLLLMCTFLTFHTDDIFMAMLNGVEYLNNLLIDAQSVGNASISKFLTDPVVKKLLDKSVEEYFSYWSIVGYTLGICILYLVSAATRAIILYTAATRTIELFAYSVFAPIGIADIFEQGPGGMVNTSSSGFTYLKKMLAIMLQIVVITVTSQCFSFITTAINKDYWNIGDNVPGVDYSSMTYRLAISPLAGFEYTSDKGVKIPIIWEWKRLAEEEATDGRKDMKSLTSVISLSGEVIDKAEYKRIVKNTGLDKDEEAFKEVLKALDTNKAGYRAISAEPPLRANYHMSIKTTEKFFDWCTGTSGRKMVMFIIMLATKILIVLTSSKICEAIVGVR